MAKKQHYMTWEERQKLEAYWNDVKMPVAKIAEIMGFCRQTIYNEIKLGTYMHTVDYKDVPRYSAEKAQQLHETAWTSKGRPEKIGSHKEYADFLEGKILRDKFSPAAALAEARKQGFKVSVCVTTLYSYIHSGLFLHVSDADLWEGGKRKKQGHRQRIAHPKLPSITERPAAAEARTEPGHWEMDLVVGKAGTKPVLLTLTERMTREEIIIWLPNKTAEGVRKALKKVEGRIKTITTDNGSEFLEYEELVKGKNGKRFEVFYCHSYASWEKGTNENHNRMIRRFFPKGTDFGKVKRRDIKRVQDWMNNYPRKILGWKTPLEVAMAG